MSSREGAGYIVAVIGAGPAGLFAARELADRGVRTVIINRDIKPGGLAEYGIYPGKTRMKEGLRNQFRQIMSNAGIEYFGNLLVGVNGDLTFDDLRSLGFQAVLVTVGAQSTKQLGIPGEELPGVYHAKDIVYHYNLLPPFSETTYQIGKRVAVVGAGNVMMDIAHWLVEEHQVETVTAVARRGPVEVKFDKKELEALAGYIDLPALEAELERVCPVMEAVGQAPDELRDMINDALKKAPPRKSDSRFRLRFLSSPVKIVASENGQVAGLMVEENKLVLSADGETKARGTGEHAVLDIDTVIFAIGDVVDAALGLPIAWGAFVNNPQPRFPVEGVSYEVYDPQADAIIEDIFLAGWARKPSTGLVGVARKDGVNAAQAVMQYLETLPQKDQPVMERVRQRLSSINHPVVDKSALLRLEAVEQARARETGQVGFKFRSNREMLEVLELEKVLRKPGS